MKSQNYKVLRDKLGTALLAAAVIMIIAIFLSPSLSRKYSRLADELDCEQGTAKDISTLREDGISTPREDDISTSSKDLKTGTDSPLPVAQLKLENKDKPLSIKGHPQPEETTAKLTIPAEEIIFYKPENTVRKFTATIAAAETAAVKQDNKKEQPDSSPEKAKTKSQSRKPADKTNPSKQESTVSKESQAAKETTIATTTAASTTETAKSQSTTIQTETAAQDKGKLNNASIGKFVQLLNDYRKDNGVGSLKSCNNLNSIAAKRAKEISIKFSHDGIRKYGNYGENIFMGTGCDSYAKAATALKAFKNSSSHNYNQLNSKYKTIGVGHYTTDCGAHYWAVIFGF